MPPAQSAYRRGAVEEFITRDRLSKLLVRLTEDGDEARHSTCIYERRLVVGVLVDEVSRGAGGVPQHGPVVAGEQLDQSRNSMQIADLAVSHDHSQRQAQL